MNGQRSPGATPPGTVVTHLPLRTSCFERERQVVEKTANAVSLRRRSRTDRD